MDESRAKPESERSILIVDDNPNNLAVMAGYLEDSGFRILVARDGEGALEKARYARPDLILLDVMMPGIDGFETCRRLKEADETGETPVIFMTALTDVADKVRGFDAGAVDYVTKPLHQAEVLARVTTHLRLRELTQRLRAERANLQQANRVLSKRALQLQTISEVGKQITSILEPDRLLREVVRLIQGQFGYGFVGIWLLEEPQAALALRAGAGDNSDAPRLGTLLRLSEEEHPIVRVCQEMQPLSAAEGLSLGGGMHEPGSALILPLRVAAQRVGALDIRSEQPDAFDSADQALLQALADQIAIAIRNAHLYQLEEQRSRDLAALNASKDRFFSLISHDLRGPFMPLLANAKLLAKSTTRFSPEYVRTINSSIYTSARLIFDLLETMLQWATLESGRLEYRPTRLNVTDVAHHNVQLLTENATAKEIQLQNNLLAPLYAYADEYMVDSVIRNLLLNAIMFTSRGGRVILSARPSPTQPGFVEIAVADTGIGISPEEQANLFKIGFQPRTLGTDNEQGAGLGLIICNEMVQQMGGRIWVESEVGRGSTFSFTLPAEQASRPTRGS